MHRTSQSLAPRRFPTRTCVACRTARQKREFVRIVRGPDGRVHIDPTGKAPGRGAYLCADGSCWTSALKKRSIERALSTALPAELQSRLAEGPDASIALGGGSN